VPVLERAPSGPSPHSILTERWYPLRFHPVQARLKASKARFKVIEAGRRSGKTEIAKRDGVERWLRSPLTSGRSDYFVGFFAPTRDQGKDIYWEHLNEFVPERFVRRRLITELKIIHVAGPTLAVVGMDKPQRAAGKPIDYAYVDEFADMKPGVWERDIRPALDTDGRAGGAWIYGVPRPSAQFKRLAELAQQDKSGEWDYFNWESASVLTKEAIDSARRDLDERTFEQEYSGRRVAASGLAYYKFDRALHLRDSLPYDPNHALVFCFDFNIEPGSAVIVQEGSDEKLGSVTNVLGEVNIPRSSNTPMVCRKLIQDWGQHKGPVHYYGDPTGGNRGTAKVAGSDWDLVQQELSQAFRGRLYDCTNRKARPERGRINALNARLQNAKGEVHMLIARPKCAMLIRDLENVLLLEGSGGELDKDRDPALTHWSDGVGYYCEQKHPIGGQKLTIQPL